MQRIRKLLAALCIAGMLAAGIGVTIFLLTQGDSLRTAAPSSNPLAPPPPSMPTPEEFFVAVQVTDQHCGTPQNCTYVYSIQPNYRGLHPLPERDFTVFYEVTGGHAAQPGTFTVSDGQARMLQGVSVDGPPNAQLNAAVTAVAPVEGPVATPSEIGPAASSTETAPVS